MAMPNKNLKAVLEYLGISNAELAKALDYDPSLISRYLTGHRVFKAASVQMDAVTEYILSRAKRMQDIEWLRGRFAEAGLPTDVSTVYRFKQNLIMWLASDGESLRKNLGRSIHGDIAGTASSVQTALLEKEEETENEVKTGFIQIALALCKMLSELSEKLELDIFLSSDRIETAMNGDFAKILLEAAAEKDLKIDMVICVSGDTQAIQRILDTYMTGLISGRIKFSTVQGITQTITGTMHVMSKESCMMISETFGAAALPVAIVVREEAFVKEAINNFISAARYAESVVRIYGDGFTRDIIEILAIEYCTPGALDVIKDSVNPMFMSCEAYDVFLKKRGHSEKEFEWRSAEFVRFKKGMDANLESGVPFREIISLSRLNDIILRGSCRMAGLYFAETGYIDLDRQGCIDILNGYIHYIETVPAFSLLILDDLSELNGNNCWHIKRDCHVTVNNWDKKEPVMIYSDRIMLLREFQGHFEELWKKGSGSVGSRANVISILNNVAAKLEKGK